MRVNRKNFAVICGICVMICFPAISSCNILKNDCGTEDASCNGIAAGLLLSAFFPATNVPALADISGLTTYLPLDGDANDSSGNNLNGTLSNGSFTSDRLGRADSAYLVDHTSTNQYVQLSNGSLNNFTDLTVAFWARLDNFHGVDRNTFISASGVNSNTGFDFQIGYYSTDNRIQVNMANTGAYSTPTSTPSDGGWHHYAVVRASGSSSLYLDGVRLATGVFVLTTAISANTDGLILGQELNTTGTGTGAGGLTGTRSLSGGIDDFRVYNRALTETEVQALFEQTPP